MGHLFERFPVYGAFEYIKWNILWGLHSKQIADSQLCFNLSKCLDADALNTLHTQFTQEERIAQKVLHLLEGGGLKKKDEENP